MLRFHPQMAKLTTASKVLIAAVVVAVARAAAYKHRDQLFSSRLGEPGSSSPAPAGSAPVNHRRGDRPVTVALSQWPGHMALVVGNGGLTTQPGSAAAAEGLDLKVVFIEDAPSKNKALIEGKVDAVWETVDELPIAAGGFKAAGVGARAFIQIGWS